MKFFKEIIDAFRMAPSNADRVGYLFGLLVRAVSALILGFFGAGVSWLAILLVRGLWITSDPWPVRILGLAFTGGFVSVAFFLFLLAWRALTNRSSRPDGGLLPPLMIQLSAILYGGLGVFGLVIGIHEGEYAIALGGLVPIVLAISVIRSSRFRDRVARSRQRFM